MNSDLSTRRLTGRRRLIAALALAAIGPALASCSSDGDGQIATEPGPIAFSDDAESTTTVAVTTTTVAVTTSTATVTSTTTHSDGSTTTTPSSDTTTSLPTTEAGDSEATPIEVVTTTTEPPRPPATGSVAGPLPPVEVQLLVAGPDGIATWSAGRTAPVVDGRAAAVAVPDGRGGAAFQDAFDTGQWTDSPSQPIRLVRERGGPSTIVVSRSAPILLQEAAITGGHIVVTFLELVDDPARCPGSEGCIGSRAVDRVAVDVDTGQETRTASAASAAATATEGTLEAVVELTADSPELVVRDTATGTEVRRVSLAGTGLSGADRIDLTGSGWAAVSQRLCAAADCLSTVVVVSPSDRIFGPIELPTATIWATR